MFDPKNRDERVKPYNQVSLDELRKLGPSDDQGLPFSSPGSKRAGSRQQDPEADPAFEVVPTLHLVFGGIGMLICVGAITWEGFSPFSRPLLPSNQQAQVIAWVWSSIAAAAFLTGLSVVLPHLFRRTSPPYWIMLCTLAALLAGFGSILAFTPEVDIT